MYGESSRQKICLQEMWCRVHRDSWRRGDAFLLWSARGIEAVAFFDVQHLEVTNHESTRQEISLPGMRHGGALHQSGGG